MQYNFTGKNVTVTEGIREYTEKHLNAVLSKSSLVEDDAKVKVLVRTYSVGQKMEVTLVSKGLIIRAEAVDEDLYVAIDKVAEKLKDQLRKYKTKVENKKKKESIADSFDEDMEEDDVVVKTKSIIPEIMEVDEAIIRMDLLGHNFFIYTDDETRKVAVVYKRHDGGYGLIETE